MLNNRVEHPILSIIMDKLYEFDYSSTFLLFFYTMIRNCKFTITTYLKFTTYLKKKLRFYFLLINFYRTSFPQFLYNEKIIINFNFLIILTCWIIQHIGFLLNFSLCKFMEYTLKLSNPDQKLFCMSSVKIIQKTQESFLCISRIMVVLQIIFIENSIAIWNVNEHSTIDILKNLSQFFN